MKTILNIDNKPFEDKSDAASTIIALNHINPTGIYEISKLESGYVIIEMPGNNHLENNHLENNDLENDRLENSYLKKR